MDFKNLIKMEMVMMTVMLFVIIATFIIILVKMRPLKDFDNIRFGKLELKRGKEEQEIDKQQNEALSIILERIDSIDKRFDGMDKRMDKMDARQDALYGYTREAVVYSTKSIVWSDQGAPYPEVVEAGLKAIMLGQNGNVIERMKIVILGQPGGLKLFRSELVKFEKLHKDKLDDHFYKAVEEMTWGMK
jgi:hypothetical protein